MLASCSMGPAGIFQRRWAPQVSGCRAGPPKPSAGLMASHAVMYGRRLSRMARALAAPAGPGDSMPHASGHAYICIRSHIIYIPLHPLAPVAPPAAPLMALAPAAACEPPCCDCALEQLGISASEVSFAWVRPVSSGVKAAQGAPALGRQPWGAACSPGGAAASPPAARNVRGLARGVFAVGGGGMARCAQVCTGVHQRRAGQPSLTSAARCNQRERESAQTTVVPTYTRLHIRLRQSMAAAEGPAGPVGGAEVPGAVSQALIGECGQCPRAACCRRRFGCLPWAWGRMGRTQMHVARATGCADPPRLSAQNWPLPFCTLAAAPRPASGWARASRRRRQGCRPAAAQRCRSPPQLSTAPAADSAFFGPTNQYVRWDTGLHEVFVMAVDELGGAHAGESA